MGWTQYVSKINNPKAELDRLCASEDGTTQKVLKSALVNLSEYYAAVQTIDRETGKRTVWAAAFLVTLNPFGYKSMSEDMGPRIHNCPESILQLLTPTGSEYATQWRADCWNTIAARAAAPKTGAYIKFAEPLKFTDGSEHQVFKIVASGRNGRGQAFCPAKLEGVSAVCEWGGRYKISNWKHRKYEVVA